MTSTSRRASRPLLPSPSASSPPAGQIDRKRVRLAIEPAVGADLIRGDHVDVFAFELVARVRSYVVRLGGEAHGERRPRQCGNARERVRRANERQIHLGGTAFDLLLGRFARPIVGDRRAADEDLGARDLVVHAAVHLLCRLDVDRAARLPASAGTRGPSRARRRRRPRAPLPRPRNPSSPSCGS